MGNNINWMRFSLLNRVFTNSFVAHVLPWWKYYRTESRIEKFGKSGGHPGTYRNKDENIVVLTYIILQPRSLVRPARVLGCWSVDEFSSEKNILVYIVQKRNIFFLTVASFVLIASKAFSACFSPVTLFVSRLLSDSLAVWCWRALKCNSLLTDGW